MEKELQLQPRLQCIAELVPQGVRLADVGTDHGYLPVWLLQHGRIESAIASDINTLPLDHARATAREYGVTEHMDFRLCPGPCEDQSGGVRRHRHRRHGRRDDPRYPRGRAVDARRCAHAHFTAADEGRPSAPLALRAQLPLFERNARARQGTALRRFPRHCGNGTGAERGGRAGGFSAAVRPAVRRIPVAAPHKAQTGEERPCRLVACG